MKVIMDFLTFLLAAIVSVVFMLINGVLSFFEMLINLIAGAC